MSGSLIVVLLAVLILAVLFIPMFGEQLKQITGLNRKLIRRYWQRIESYQSHGEAGIRKAIKEADRLLDYVLRKGRYGGGTMAERLKQADNKFSDVNNVLRAHNLRNRLNKEAGLQVGQSRAKQTLSDFQQALKDLGAL